MTKKGIVQLCRMLSRHSTTTTRLLPLLLPFTTTASTTAQTTSITTSISTTATTIDDLDFPLEPGDLGNNILFGNEHPNEHSRQHPSERWRHMVFTKHFVHNHLNWNGFKLGCVLFHRNTSDLTLVCFAHAKRTPLWPTIAVWFSGMYCFSRCMVYQCLRRAFFAVLRMPSGRTQNQCNLKW